MAIPAPDLRNNIATWAVPVCQVPAVATILRSNFGAELFDPDFKGQELETVYFDTRDLLLREARRKGKRYLTLRVRCYQPSDTYALSVKTESQRFRAPISANVAEDLLDGNWAALPNLLPGDLQARLLDLVGDAELGGLLHPLRR
jgi:hypothetical protein